MKNGEPTTGASTMFVFPLVSTKRRLTKAALPLSWTWNCVALR